MIQRIVRCAAAALTFVLIPFATPASADANTIAVPGGTPISIHLTDALSSGTAHVGDRFAFSVADDVLAGGCVVILAGAQGVGEVVNAENAGSNGHPGKLGLQFDYVYAVDGEKIRVTQTSNGVEGEQRKGAASTATIASYALLGPVGLFAHNWIKGREVSVSPKALFSVFVDSTVHVVATVRQTVRAEFAH